MTEIKLGTQAIGAAGELLVQYQLLKLGIDSARLTTDSGIDLVMYVPGQQSAATIQVKTKLKPVPAGGTGKPSLGWRFPIDCKAQWLACVDMSRDAVWLFTIEEAIKYAKQTPPQLYWYVDEAPVKALREVEMDYYRLEPVITRLLGGQPRELP
ncbi:MULTISPECIES: hypothetical protein [Mycolicibacter]|uniref:DUF4365 domain-containing protein n=1 Tax=Mycolicibacter kumamotonensis TaxID=354243 RepID=A0A1B8SDK4_9MYCO|nr:MULTISPECIES: hypothetical protein [Mycolicibacter]KAA1431098.1 hypothetical protein F0402_10630 [Mycolicibacter arupensis]OBY30797.1 hypothetical protein ACT18_15815 [Mycolicibacter kumamotonensis]ULP48682.1 hypothetical protein MJO54_06145 [Mycolicibacter virginiensis]